MLKWSVFSQFLKFILIISQFLREIKKSNINKICLKYNALYYISNSANLWSFLRSSNQPSKAKIFENF